MPTLHKLSTAELTAELARREKSSSKLRARRDALQAQVAQIDSELLALGGAAPKRGPGRPPKVGGASAAPRAASGKRPKNSMGLHDALASAIKVGSTVSPKDAVRIVKAAGYRTVSKTFGIQVAARLAGDKRFKRVGRGQYKRIK